MLGTTGASGTAIVKTQNSALGGEEIDPLLQCFRFLRIDDVGSCSSTCIWFHINFVV
jgi:hypothetical protein